MTTAVVPSLQAWRSPYFTRAGAARRVRPGSDPSGLERSVRGGARVTGLLAGLGAGFEPSAGAFNSEALALFEINPYPGALDIERWEGGALIVRSESILSSALRDGSMPEGCASWDWQDGEQMSFVIDPRKGSVMLSPSDERHAREVLAARYPETTPQLESRACVLGALDGRAALPALRRMCQQRSGQDCAYIQELISQLEAPGSASASPSTRMRWPDTPDARPTRGSGASTTATTQGPRLERELLPNPPGEGWLQVTPARPRARLRA